jgi:hypothetical protein
MTTLTPTTDACLSDSRRLAAEEAALQLGWLSECPYHGEPFRSDGAREDLHAIATVPADVIELVTEVCDGFADRCPFCMRESGIPE